MKKIIAMTMLVAGWMVLGNMFASACEPYYPRYYRPTYRYCPPVRYYYPPVRTCYPTYYETYETEVYYGYGY